MVHLYTKRHGLTHIKVTKTNDFTTTSLTACKSLSCWVVALFTRGPLEIGVEGAVEQKSGKPHLFVGGNTIKSAWMGFPSIQNEKQELSYTKLVNIS